MTGQLFKILSVSLLAILLFAFYQVLQSDARGDIADERLFGAQLELPSDVTWVNKAPKLSIDKPVALYFLASWCATCRVEYREFIKHHHQDVQWVAVLYFDQADEAARVFPEMNENFTGIINDQNGKLALEYGVEGTPEILLFEQGRLLKRTMHSEEIK